MPSATSVFSVGLLNVGPLTTTFTAPEACSTTDHVYLGLTSRNGAAYYQSECATTLTSPIPTTCSPSGPSVDALISSWEASQDVIQYHSPGLVCPDSWITVGVAVKDDEGSTSSSGFYSPLTTTATDDIDIHPRLNPRNNMFMDALDNGETAVACCPSDFEPNQWGMCYSTVPLSLYEATVGCQIIITNDLPIQTETIPFFGETVTAWIQSWPTTGGGELVTSTIEPSLSSNFVALTQVRMVTLVHKAGDATQTDSTSSPTDTGAAMASTQPASSMLRAVVTVWAVAAIGGFLVYI